MHMEIIKDLRTYFFVGIVSLLFIYFGIFDKGMNIFLGETLCRYLTIPLGFWAVSIAYFIVYKFYSKNNIELKEFLKITVLMSIVLAGINLVRNYNLKGLLGSFYGLYAFLYIAVLVHLFSIYAALKIKSRFYFPYILSAILMSSFLLGTKLRVAGVINIALILYSIYGLEKSGILESIRSLIRRLAPYQPIIIFAAAFFIRILFSFLLIHKLGNDYIIASDDGLDFNKYAGLLSKGIVTPFYSILFEPGYWIFLGGIYKIFGQNFYIVSLIQSLLGATIPLCIYLISRNHFKMAMPFAAGITCAADIMLIHLSAVLGMEALFLPAFVFGVYLVFQYKNENGFSQKIRTALIGIMFGVISISRIIIFPTLFIGILWMFFKRKGKIRGFLYDLVIIFAMIMLINAPIVIKNYRCTGKILFSNLNKRGNQHYSIENEKLIRMGINPFKDPIGSLKVIVRNPSSSIKAIYESTMPRVIKVGFSSYFGSFDPIFLLNPRGTPNKFAQTLEFYTYVFLLYGIFLSIKMGYRESYPLLLMMSSIIVIYSFFYILNARYRAPIQPFVYIYVILGVSGLLSAGQKPRI